MHEQIGAGPGMSSPLYKSSNYVSQNVRGQKKVEERGRASSFVILTSLVFFFSLTHAGKTRTKEKYRVVYTDHQRLELEKEFHFNRYITIRRKSELAVNLGLSERQVRPQ